MKLLTTMLLAAFSITAAQTLTAKNRVSIHDPSVVYDESSQRYYIFGSHRGVAWSTDLQNWTSVAKGKEKDISWSVGVPWGTSVGTNVTSTVAFNKPIVKTVPKGGEQVDFPAFNAKEWSALGGENYDIAGNLWAPDVIYNPTMGKWCMYMSVNGDNWMSSVVLLTANKIEGPYTYQGPVVISGFRSTAVDFHQTDLELVIGQQSSLPARYNHASTANGQMWGDWWPNNIDPCVFYDEDGVLRLIYGSWSGGIWMLTLNPENGLRDYDVTYTGDYDSKGKAMTSDPYFGKRIAGGCYSSGEGAYIQHIGDYYYLFVSYGGFGPNEGYEMRVFRSQNPEGPYLDTRGQAATYDKWTLNYGLKSDTRGEKLLGAYNQWGSMTVGECAQGHNSVVATPDDRHFLVYHTKFNNGTFGHEVRVHQLFVNADGWLVAAPFEYNGEDMTDTQIASSQLLTKEDIAGTYSLLIHKYRMDYANYEEVTPVQVTLTGSGQVTGDRTGTWSLTDGTGYITVMLGGVKYNGVVFSELTDNNVATAAFTACASSTGANIWGYQLEQEKPVEPVDGWYKGMVAHYGFDNDGLTNTFDDKQTAQLLKNGDNTAPVLVQDGGLPKGNQVSLNFGINANESYVEMPNPLLGKTLDEGATLSFWVKRADENAWDALFGFVKGDARLYMTGNSYLGYNGWDGYWIDLNHPNAAISDNITPNNWQLVTLVVSRQDIALYVNGAKKTFATCNGEMNGTGITRVEDFDYGRIVNLLTTADGFYLGRGSFWGSAPASFDDVVVYNRPLQADEVQSLYMMEVLGFDFASLKEEQKNDEPGDVNDDGKVDIVDVTMIISEILGQQPEGFNRKAADVNGDEKIDIVDVTSTIDIILNH